MQEQAITREYPTVSVITLNWNGKKHLAACYRSLYELDYPQEKLELILVDNGSTDGSLEFMQQHYPHVKIISNRTNLGFAKANNLGAQEARGDYVAFLNNDTRVHPAWLGELTQAVQSTPETVCAASKIMAWDGDRVDFVGGSLNFYGWGFQPAYGAPDAPAFSEPKEILFACGGSMLIDRAIFLDCGGFDQDFFIYYEDVDLGWRLWLLGYQVVFVPQAITYHRFHGDTGKVQDEKRISIAERNALLTIIKNYDDENLARILPAALLLLLERAYLSAAIDDSTYKLDAHQQPAARIQAPPGESGPGGIAAIQAKIRHQGPWRTAQRAASKAWRTACRWFIRRFNKQLEAVPRNSLSPLVAAHDLIQLLPQVMAKRAEIQQRRKRSDAELWPLFQDPFHPSLRQELYVQAQQRIVNACGIQGLFGQDTRMEGEVDPK